MTLLAFLAASFASLILGLALGYLAALHAVHVYAAATRKDPKP